MNARLNQNIFDLADQYFGDMNHVVQFAVDNGFTLNQILPIDQELVINNPVGTGDDNNKEAIVVQDLTFNNDQAINILAQGIGYWKIGSTFKVS